MAETGGIVPRIGVCHLKRGSVKDGSVQDAVFGTEGVLYTKVSDLAANCDSNMINDSYGTRGVAPTQLTHFRGYPKAEVTYNWEIVSFDTNKEKFMCKPTLTRAIGFDLVITITFEEAFLADGIGNGDENDFVFTIAAGGTTVTSVSFPATATSTPDGSGRYRLGIAAYFMETYETDVVFSAGALSSEQTYNTDGVSSNGTLTLGVSSYSFSVWEADGAIDCSTNTYAPESTVWKSTASAIANGDVLYTDASLTTPLGNGSYASTDPSSTPFDHFRIQNGAGTVLGFSTCT